MQSRTRNILILILSLLVGGGFLFYVMNQNKEGSEHKAIKTEDFIPISANGYAIFQFNALRDELKEETKDLDGAFLATIAANQFIAEHLSHLKKEEACAVTHMSDSISPYLIFIGQLNDSLSDLQQSGFVLRKSVLDGQVFAGQHKNLFMAVVSDSSMTESLAVERCNTFIKSEKRNDLVFTADQLQGQIHRPHNIYPHNIVADSFEFSLAFVENELVIQPYFNGLINEQIFCKQASSKVFKNDTVRNSINIKAFPKAFLTVVDKLDKVQKLKEKLHKVDLDIPLLEAAWNGSFIYNDLGQKTITNSYIIYEMDDEFNTIEVEKKTEKKISAFAIAIGVDQDKQHGIFNELLNRKLIKEQGDHYVLLNVLDAEVRLHEEGNYFILSNMPNVELIEKKAIEPSEANWNIKGKTVSVIMDSVISIRY